MKGLASEIIRHHGPAVLRLLVRSSQRLICIPCLMGMLLTSCSADETVRPRSPRRILYNLDGDSCINFKKGVYKPVETTADDLRTIVDEVSFPGSQVDTFLVNVLAQSMYYPTRIGTMRGTLSSPADRVKWGEWENMRFETMNKFFARGEDPYAIMLAQAKKKGMEAMLSFRVNDSHGYEMLLSKFWRDHPEYHIGGSLNFAFPEVREHIFQLVREAVQRYDCDGIELDFQRHPRYFKPTTPLAERRAALNDFVQRVRKMVDEEGVKRKKKLILAARVPTSPDQARELGEDAAYWAEQKWIDFLTIAEFLYIRHELPVKPWRTQIKNIPLYASIEAWTPDPKGNDEKGHPTPDEYRREALHLWKEKVDGIYLFNFFTPREDGPRATEPAFFLLGELGDRKRLEELLKPSGR